MSNRVPTGMPFKKPLKFKTVKELEDKIDAYFASLWDYGRDMYGNRLKDKEYKPQPGDENNPRAGYVMKKIAVATVTGLAVFLDTTRETLMDYESGKYDDHDIEGNAIELDESQQEWNEQVAKYSDTIKKAKQMIYADTEQMLFKPGAATGAIFSLKNNYGWHDKKEHEINDPDNVLNPLKGLKTDELRQLIKGK